MGMRSRSTKQIIELYSLGNTGLLSEFPAARANFKSFWTNIQRNSLIFRSEFSPKEGLRRCMKSVCRFAFAAVLDFCHSLPCVSLTTFPRCCPIEEDTLGMGSLHRHTCRLS